MRLIFIGSTILTRTCIEKIMELGKDTVLAVITITDKDLVSRARGVLFDDLTGSGITVLKTDDINSETVFNFVKVLRPDVIVQCGWSQKIAQKIMDIPRNGCIGIHASFLPQNRGAASLNWAIINDLKETGVSLFYMTESYDDGDIINQQKISIEDRDDIATLHYKSDVTSCNLLIEALDNIGNGTVRRIKQDSSLASYTKRRKPEDGLIQWDSGQKNIKNFVRALTRPFSGAFSFIHHKKIILWRCARVNTGITAEPGEVLDVIPGSGILVSTGQDAILIEEVGFDNFNFYADDFARRAGIRKGDKFGD